MINASFSSITGISLSAAGAGEVVKISYRLNCKDETQVNRSIISRNMLDDLVYPEIMKQVSKGTLSTNFRLRKVHVMMFSNESKNKLLLNGRTRFRVQIKPKAEMEKQLIRENDIEEILGIYPSKENDPNAAHVMMFKFKGDWLISYDFTYNLEKSGKHVELAKGHIKLAEQALENREFGLSIRNQHKAAILSFQSILVLNNPRLSFKTNTSMLTHIFSEYIKNGNLDAKYSDLFIKDSLRVGDEANATEGIRQKVRLTKELAEQADLKLRSVEFYRSPPTGVYIN